MDIGGTEKLFNFKLLSDNESYNGIGTKVKEINTSLARQSSPRFIITIQILIVNIPNRRERQSFKTSFPQINRHSYHSCKIQLKKQTSVLVAQIASRHQ